MQNEITRDSIALISNHNNTFLANSSIFESSEAKFIFVGCDRDPLSEKSYITHRVIFQTHEQCNGSLHNLIENLDVIQTLPEFVLIEVDDALFEISRSSLTDDLKQKLLPIKDSKFFKVAGSKIGQAQLFQTLEIPHPSSQIIHSGQIASPLVFPLIAKRDRGAAGSQVRLLNNLEELMFFESEADQPYILQEFIKGEEIAVEGFYRNGQLVFLNFSKVTGKVGDFGISYKRKYYKKVPAEIIDSMSLLGFAMKFNGFVNSTWIFNTISKRYQIFEFDVRMNIWSHLATKFGFNPSDFFSSNPKVQKIRNIYFRSSIEFLDIRRFWLDLDSRDSFSIRKKSLFFLWQVFKTKLLLGKVINSFPYTPRTVRTQLRSFLVL